MKQEVLFIIHAAHQGRARTFANDDITIGNRFLFSCRLHPVRTWPFRSLINIIKHTETDRLTRR
uniref:Uncharacterized protein n=1 Tax=Daphnia magna TaxID=35525 RepID=A0A0P6GX98_9CRUS